MSLLALKQSNTLTEGTLLQALFSYQPNFYLERAVLRRSDRHSYNHSLQQQHTVGIVGSSEKQRLSKASYYIYFIIMNYYALNPSVAFSTAKTAKNQASQSPMALPLILQTISMALTNSLKNYHNVLLVNNSPLQTPKQTTHMANQGSIIQNTPNLSPDAQSLLPLPERIQIKHVPKEKGVLTRKEHSSRAKTNHHLSTSQELMDQKPQKVKPLRDERTRQKSTAECQKTDLSTQTVSQPVVDLIETAYLPQCGMKRSELAGIRLSLEERKVGKWNDKLKIRRDKRQLRLLGC